VKALTSFGPHPNPLPTGEGVEARPSPLGEKVVRVSEPDEGCAPRKDGSSVIALASFSALSRRERESSKACSHGNFAGDYLNP